MTDEKFHLIFGMGICGYLFILILMTCQWFQDGCSESFALIVVASFFAEILLIVLCGLFFGAINMFFKFLDND